MNKGMKIAIMGLGRMGGQIARKLHEGGYTVIAHNRSKDPVDQMKALGMLGAYNKEEVVSAFGADQIILWLMIPAEIVEQELSEWLKIIREKNITDSIIIDGGNSDFRNTKKHAEVVKASGSVLIDVGTSGGVWGYQNGFCMMAGGDAQAFKVVEPVLETLGKPAGGYKYFGENGSGHYVKMIHNAIEYGMMESIAEGYRLLKEGPYKNLDLVAAGDVWQKKSVITSWLNELTANALRENPTLEGIEGKVAESGEARFALEVAKEFKIPVPSIQASFEVRLASQKGEVNFATKLLALMRNAFGGHKINLK